MDGRWPLQEFTKPQTGQVEDTAFGHRIAAPRPGLAKDAPLMILEAMKMEHTLTAPRNGIVAELLTKTGAQVAGGEMFLALEPIDA